MATRTTTQLFVDDNNNLKDELKDRFCSIEALLGEIETPLGTAQEFEHVGYIQEIAKLTQKNSDINAKHGDDIKDTELEALRVRLTNIKRRENKNWTWNAEKITNLVNKDSTTPLAELKTGLLRKTRSMKSLLDDTTMPQATAQDHEHKRHIRGVNNLTMEAGPKLFNIEAKHRGHITTEELNILKTSLTDVRHRKAKIFADIRVEHRRNNQLDQQSQGITEHTCIPPIRTTRGAPQQQRQGGSA